MTKLAVLTNFTFGAHHESWSFCDKGVLERRNCQKVSNTNENENKAKVMLLSELLNSRCFILKDDSTVDINFPKTL